MHRVASAESGTRDQVKKSVSRVVDNLKTRVSLNEDMKRDMCRIMYLELRVLTYKTRPQGKHVILTYEG